MKKKIIILIGGAPTVGKSTIAKGLSKCLGIPWISTDQIRNIARNCTRHEDNPKLFNPITDGEEFLNTLMLFLLLSNIQTILVK